MKEKGGLHILDALENLNTLVDAESLEEIEVTDDSLLIPHKGEKEGEGHDIYWVQAGPDTQTLIAIKDTFNSVHDYLQTFYSKMKKNGDTKRLVEGINTIMVLVGEATQNFERFGTLFKERISDFEEYKQLQNFYRNRVIKESFREFAKVPLPKKESVEKTVLPEQIEAEEELQELLSEEKVEEVGGVHILNDLDVIKRDHNYELFYLKNEAGHHFYTYELARTIKLACDFGEFAQEYFGDDPLLQIKNWEDKSLNLRADQLLKKCHHAIEKFYREAMKYKEMDVVASVHNALMALMMAANPRNLIRQFSLKGCHLYFNDFFLFLRETLNNREYQKFLIYSPPPGKPFFQDLLNLVQQLCYHLFTMGAFDEELTLALKQIIERTHPKKHHNLSKNIEEAHLALTDVLKKHPNGPVFKVVDIIREQEELIFDPMMQGNIPGKQWSILKGEKEIACIRTPCPIMQEVIDRAYVTAEFKTFLAETSAKEQILLINYQDRTSWKEHARSLAIEELALQAEFAANLTVVTLAKDTDFYNQMGHYQEVGEAELFMDHFQQHLNDEITGYYFPPKLKKELFSGFVQELLNQIHRTFFGHKERLSFLERLDFIQLAYHFIELKLIELVQPSLLFLSSKDGLDMIGTTNVGLIALLTVSKGKKWSEKESDRLNTLLFGPTLMNRERAIHPERFERLISMVELLENAGDYLKHFSELYNIDTLNSTVSLD